jgi:galactonate dehydratase
MPQQKSSALSLKRSRLAAFAAQSVVSGSKPQIAITGVEASPVREPVGGRTYVIVQVKTDAGITGVGETTAVESRLLVERLDQLKAKLIGQDALGLEALKRMIAREAGSALERASIYAAMNMALLDVLGKLSKAPAYEVLGGRTREKARGFAVLHGIDETALRTSMDRAKATGYKAFSVPLKMPQGPTRGRTFYRETHQLLENLRKAAGEGSDFILDCGAQLSASEAAGLAVEFERFHLLWLEEPTAEMNGKAFSKISAESVTPVGIGRNVVDHAEFQNLLRMDSIDVLRPDMARSGISEVRRAAALAESYYVAIAPFHRGGPVGTAAALHAAASVPNFFIQEVPFAADDRDVAMRRELVGADLEKAQDGFLPLPSGHGLGVTLNEDAVRKYALRT